MRVIFYGNRQAGMVVLLTTLAMAHDVVEVWEDCGYGIPGIQRLSLRRRVIGCQEDFIPPDSHLNLDLFLCAHGRCIVPGKVLRTFRLGGINVHPFLDRFPGARPVERAIAAGVEEASVHAHKMTAKVDSGRVIAVASDVVPGKEGGQKMEPERFYNILYPLYADVTAAALIRLASPKGLRAQG